MKRAYLIIILLISPLLWSASCQQWARDFEKEIEIDSRSLTESNELEVSIQFPSNELQKKNVERISFQIFDSGGELIGKMSQKILDRSNMIIREQFNYPSKAGQRLKVQPILFRKAKELQLTALTTIVAP